MWAVAAYAWPVTGAMEDVAGARWDTKALLMLFQHLWGGVAGNVCALASST